MCSDLTERSIINDDNEYEDSSCSATDPEKIISSINEALTCVIKEARSKFETEQKLLSELLTIHEDVMQFQSTWEDRKITLASKLEDVIRTLTEIET